MIKNSPFIIWAITVLVTSLFTSHSTIAEPVIISIEQMTKDVSYLANDNLKGRSNFSQNIKQAANYIATRFDKSGLKSARGISAHGFLQKYHVKHFKSETLSFRLNGQEITPENLTIVSHVNKFLWQIENGNKKGEFTILSLDKDDDVRATLSKLNAQGGHHLVLVNSAHLAIFKRTQHYFEQGIFTPIEENQPVNKGGTIVLALSDITADEVSNLTVSATNSISTRELSNVVAVLPGQTKPEEIILYSAHYDHLGTTNSKGDSIYNGADDNASGTTAIINIAQYFAKQGNNARTLMFAAFSAEEIGGFGSQYLSKQVEPQKIIAMINIEMIGKPSKFGIGTLWMTGIDRSNLGKQLNIELAALGKKIHADPYPEQGLFYRSDNATLARLGVPAHSFSSVQLDKDEHYHKVSDDLASLNLHSMHKVIETLIIATTPLVSGTMTPSRIDVSKVKNKGLIY